MTTNSPPPAFVARRAYKSLYGLVPLLALLAGGRALGAVLPPSLAPPAPFPLVTASSTEREAVAPGITRATYRLLTSAGPMVVSVIGVDPKEPSVRLGTVLARDTINSKDEPVSSMARRTGAVAGINGDYFDINASGAPLGVLVRAGRLERTPGTRIALTVTRERDVRFETYRFSGSVTAGATQVPLTAINEWPPRNGAALLTPAFGAIPPGANGAGISLLEIQPMAPGSGGERRYRVASVANGPPYPASSLRLAYGSAAQGFGPVPDVGDVVVLAYDTDPPLAGVAAAVGGGPELLHGGVAIDDPSSPNYADRDKRIPVSAAARFADGTLALVVVDGRRPQTSIGVNRAELIALLRGLGAVDAMLFDSGGSATLAARVLGDAAASVVNEPSDGVERPVADGLFVYSDAPVGPPSRLVVRPSPLVVLAGAQVSLRARIVDANGHGLGAARGPWRVEGPQPAATIGEDDVLHAGTRPGTSVLRVTRGGVSADVALEIADRVARLVVGPPRANPDPHGAVALTVEAFDARGRPVATGGVVRWKADNASIDATGRLAAGDRDAIVTASAGRMNATVTIPVGRHTVPLALDGDRRVLWRLVTTPANGPGMVAVDGDRLQLSYDFTAGERAAFAVASPELRLGEPLALSCAVDGDGNGEALRATFADRYGDRETATFARAIDFTVTRRLNVNVPLSLAPPVTLRNVYAVGTLANPPIVTAGTLTVHDCIATIAGSAPPPSPSPLPLPRPSP